MKSFNLNRIERRWRQFYARVSIGADFKVVCDRVFNRLVDAYTQPERYYHNLNHIDGVLTTLDRFNDLQNPRSVYLAAWFHDFVYDPKAVDNEAKSAEAAQELLTSLGESTATIALVQQLILATQGHQIDSGSRSMYFFGCRLSNSRCRSSSISSLSTRNSSRI